MNLSKLISKRWVKSKGLLELMRSSKLIFELLSIIHESLLNDE